MIISARYSLILCLNLFWIFSLFVYIVFRWPLPSWSHRHPRFEKLCKTSRSVSSEMMKISSLMAYLSAFKSTGILLHPLLFKYPHWKNQVLLGPANEEAMAHHLNEKSPVEETNARSADVRITAVWALAPSCCKQRLWFDGIFGAIYSLITTA